MLSTPFMSTIYFMFPPSRLLPVLSPIILFIFRFIDPMKLLVSFFSVLMYYFL